MLAHVMTWSDTCMKPAAGHSSFSKPILYIRRQYDAVLPLVSEQHSTSCTFHNRVTWGHTTVYGSYTRPFMTLFHTLYCIDLVHVCQRWKGCIVVREIQQCSSCTNAPTNTPVLWLYQPLKALSTPSHTDLFIRPFVCIARGAVCAPHTYSR